MSKATAQQSSGGSGNADDISPHFERPCPYDATLAGGDVVAAEMAEVGRAVQRSLLRSTSAPKKAGSRHEMLFSPSCGVGFGLNNINGLEHASRER